MNILVTGGTGYIGSHLCIRLLEKGHNVVILDNLSNSKIEVVDKIILLTKKVPKFIRGDIGDYALLKAILKENKIDIIYHLAALKSIPESIKSPAKYFENNYIKTGTLLKAMDDCAIKNIIFASSAAVYSTSNFDKLSEDAEILLSTNAYAQSKIYCENLFRMAVANDIVSNATILRYFNVVGAHKSGILGEDFETNTTNLFPSLLKSIKNNKPFIISGNNHKTKDGTCARDYIHINDLVEANILALNNLNGYKVYNIGSSKLSSVLDVINTFEKISNLKVDIQIGEARLGDLDKYYANISKARAELGFNPKHTLKNVCKDT